MAADTSVSRMADKLHRLISKYSHEEGITHTYISQHNVPGDTVLISTGPSDFDSAFQFVVEYLAPPSDEVMAEIGLAMRKAADLHPEEFDKAGFNDRST